MMELYNKSTRKLEIIYAVLDDDHGYPKFLIRKDNQWVYRSAKHYITKDEQKKIDLKEANDFMNEIINSL